MRKDIRLLILAGLMGVALAIVWRGATGVKQPHRLAPEQKSSGELRVQDFNAQIAAFAEVDTELIHYREVAAITPVGLPTLTAIAVDTADRIYAAGGTAVLMMSPEGDPIRALDVADEVSCLAVDGDGRLYVGMGASVHMFDAEGAPDGQFEGLAPRAFVTSLAIVGDVVFAADAGRRRIIRFGQDGVLMDEVDGTGGESDAVGFVVPSLRFDLAAGQGQTVWAVNPGRLRLEEYTVNGERIRVWEERSGMGIEEFSGCCNPTHIARLSDGSIITSEKGIARIKVYSPRGRFMSVVAAPKDFDADDSGLDLAVDSQDRILVADAVRRQIRVFEKIQ